MDKMWTTYEVRWDFLTKLVSSVPADPEMVRRWLETRAPLNRPPDSKSIDQVQEEVMSTLPVVPEVVEEQQEAGMQVFQRQEGGLVVRMSTIRAHLKDCARVLSRLYIGKVEKESSFSVKILNGVYYPPEVYWVPILSQTNGTQLRSPSGEYDVAVHAQTPRGPIHALKRFEYVLDARLDFKLLVLTPPALKGGKRKPVVALEDLETLMQYGGVHGYAGERSAGEGRYFPTIKEAE